MICIEIKFSFGITLRSYNCDVKTGLICSVVLFEYLST